ncbi:hypothetical protein C8R46DRAFT_1163680 [Mycena filopes]|nr:hypothetical protein C8R46DRAFT_1163680 [Mycena filopes]
MPPTRKDDGKSTTHQKTAAELQSKADFEAIGGSRVKCLLCSQSGARIVEISHSSIAQHHATNRHKAATKERELRDGLAADMATATAALRPSAEMLLAQQYQFSDSEDEDPDVEMPQPPLDNNPFEGVRSYDDMFLDSNGDEIFFSAGEVPVDDAAQKIWTAMDDLDYYQHSVFRERTKFMSDLFDGMEDSTITGATAAMNSLGLGEDDEEEDDESEAAKPGIDYDGNWAPHGSKTECGTPEVPSFYALCKLQAKLTKEIGLKPRHHTSSLGNQFYMNHPIDLIRLDFANPLVRESIHFYPEVTSTVSEFWQAAKYVDELSPMWADWAGSPYHHFHVKELVQCCNGTFVVPIKCVVFQGVVHAESYQATREQKLAQEYFPLGFCATSPQASALEQFDALAEDCNATDWAPAYDCLLQREILFQVRAHLLPADNPQQAESTSTSGASELHKRQYRASKLKSKQHVLQEQIYNADTRDARLNDCRIKGDERTAIEDALITKIQDDLFRWIRAGDHYNVLLRVRGLDPSPCEILHTILLGEDKYVWHETNKSWNEEQCKLFADRLQSASTDGLSIPALRPSDMAQYKNSLIGKHFKPIQQLAVFHLDDKLCSPQVFNLWRANDELGALLWHTEIKDMTQYLANLQVAINNVLDNWAIVDPIRIIKKFKLHVLPHTPEHVRRFGPAPLFATEVFECWNAVFPLCSVLSNHQAPSLDISTIMDMERFKHQVSGGWWTAGEGGDWIQGGTHVRNFPTRNKQLQRRLGWTDPDLLKPAGDICGPGSWIFSTTDFFQSSVIAGRIVKSLLPDNHSSGLGSFTVVEQFNVSDVNDARLNMPLLLRVGRSLVVAAKDILFQFNAQHDCRHCECQFVTVPGPRQERQASKLTGHVVAHTEDSRYHLNMHALHNAHLIRETLPRHLTAPKPCFTDRRSKHDEFAAVLREIGPVKRADIVAKTQATKQCNKQDKAEKLAGAQERGTNIS